MIYHNNLSSSLNINKIFYNKKDSQKIENFELQKIKREDFLMYLKLKVAYEDVIALAYLVSKYKDNYLANKMLRTKTDIEMGVVQKEDLYNKLCKAFEDFYSPIDLEMQKELKRMQNDEVKSTFQYNTFELKEECEKVHRKIISERELLTKKHLIYDQYNKDSRETILDFYKNDEAMSSHIKSLWDNGYSLKLEIYTNIKEEISYYSLFSRKKIDNYFEVDKGYMKFDKMVKFLGYSNVENYLKHTYKEKLYIDDKKMLFQDIIKFKKEDKYIHFPNEELLSFLKKEQINNIYKNNFPDRIAMEYNLNKLLSTIGIKAEIIERTYIEKDKNYYFVYDLRNKEFYETSVEYSNIFNRKKNMVIDEIINNIENYSENELTHEEAQKEFNVKDQLNLVTFTNEKVNSSELNLLNQTDCLTRLNDDWNLDNSQNDEEEESI